MDFSVNPFIVIRETTQAGEIAGLRNRAPLPKGRCGRCRSDEECGLTPGSRLREPEA
ncbi:MAG TPA: hypothetical protein VFY85_15315 [Gemmatimonadaceae bacterium]|nr:hypothetical protein [Gemmatimonadaceae bacterium]